MTMQDFYRELMKINTMDDTLDKAEYSRAFFEKLNEFPQPAYFNWAAEVFDGIHLNERGEQASLVWLNLDSGERRQFSYKEFARIGNQFLNFLRGRGLSKGHTVYMMVPSLPETWFASYATIKGGFVSVPTATVMTTRELEYRFKTYPPHAILADANSAKTIDEALENTGSIPSVKIIIGKKEGWTSHEEILRQKMEAEPESTASADPILCFFTSGTTGMAKRVTHTAVSYPVGHLSTANMIGLRPGEMHHNLSQPGWAKWAWSSFFAPLNMGATSTGFHYEGRLDIDKYLGAVAEYKVNTFCAPPTAWRAFVLADLKKFDFSSLRESVSAGEPLNPETIQTWQKYTNTVIRDFYGQTESTAMIGNPPWAKREVIPGSFGRPSFLYDVVLLDDEGKEISKTREVGHIAVRLDRWRAKGLFDEYVGDPSKMRDVFVGNYYHTGDRALFDENGNWWFVGRCDDVIKSSDYRIGPFEVESALVEHPSVAEAAVIGSPDPKRWQVVKGFVILRPGVQPSRELAADLFRHCTDVLAKFKIPRIIEFVPEVPKTISGKIRRIELRQNEVAKREQGGIGANEFFYQDFPELRS